MHEKKSKVICELTSLPRLFLESSSPSLIRSPCLPRNHARIREVALVRGRREYIDSSSGKDLRYF